MQHLAGESTDDSLMRCIFLQRPAPTYLTVLYYIGRDTPIKKLAEITDNIVNVTATHMMYIDGIPNLESDHLVKILEARNG